MLREALSRSGYTVWEAENGSDALRQREQMGRAPDLLVSDVVMPVMNGFKLMTTLRSRDSDVKVLLMSGHAEDVIKEQGVLDPDVEILPKPFLPDVLVNKVRTILDQQAIPGNLSITV